MRIWSTSAAHTNDQKANCLKFEKQQDDNSADMWPRGGLAAWLGVGAALTAHLYTGGGAQGRGGSLADFTGKRQSCSSHSSGSG